MLEFSAIALVMGVGFAAICYYRHRQHKNEQENGPIEMDTISEL